MADLHPATLAALEAGPQLVSSWHTEISTKESPAAFARRIALLAMQEEREECEMILRDLYLNAHPDASVHVMQSAIVAIRRRGKP